MKISVNDQELFTLSATQKKVICDDVHVDHLEEDLKRRLNWVLIHKYEQCFKRLKDEWDAKLAADGLVASVPTDPDAYAELIFSLPEYKDRKARDAESI